MKCNASKMYTDEFIRVHAKYEMIETKRSQMEN